MGLPIVVTKTLTAASANNIATSQTPGGAGNLTINGSAATGGVATLDTQRRVIITSAANDSGRTFTIFGTNEYNAPIFESVTGANAGVATSLRDYKTVTRIAVDAATAGAVTVGTSTVGATSWLSLSSALSPVSIAASVIVSGTINFTVQYTYDPDPFGFFTNPPPVANTWNHPTLTGTATIDGTFSFPVTGIRLLINSGTGSATLNLEQAGIAGNP